MQATPLEIDIRHDCERNVILVTARGELDNASCLEVAGRLIRIWEETGCLRALVDCRETRLTDSTVGIYESPGLVARAGLPRAMKLARVYSRDREAHLFWETVSCNHGYNARAFEDLDEALGWLREADRPGGAESPPD